MEVEVSAAEDRISAVAAAVETRLAAVADVITEFLTREIESLRDDERIVALLGASVAENVATLLHVLQHGIDPERIEAPVAAAEYARRLAQRGVPMVALIRAYRIGQARFLRWCMDELASEPVDPRVELEATWLMTERSFAYIDRISELMIDHYQAEHDRWLHNRAAVRAARVRSLLAGDDTDLDAAESVLGYRLRRHQLGAVAWLPHPARGHDGLLELEHAATEIASRSGLQGRPLFVPVDDSSAWVWLPLGSEHGVEEATVRAALEDGDACVALGEPGDGVEGFRRTHSQALAAQAVALAAGPGGPRVTAFAAIRPIALMAGELDATRAWVQETLGALAIDDERHARLRTTLRVFLSTGGSYTATAERLTLHKNTVHYRVSRAEEMRGRPISPDRLDVELALLACDSLGSAVLRPPSES